MTEYSNPWVFVVGCPRSGTTLLQRMLDNHPELAVANDTHFIMRAAKRILRKDPNPELTPELVNKVRNYRRFYRMGLEVDEVDRAARDNSTYAGFVSHLYSMRGEKMGKRLSGEKTPDFCRSITTLHKLFPRARFIHIIRDGRETALSAMDWATKNKGPGKLSLWAEDPVACAALWWKWQAGTGLEQGRHLGNGLSCELKYEDLVDDPQGKLRQMAEFLEIPYSKKMALYHQGRTRKNSGLSAKSAWLPPTKGLRDWRNDMTRQDVAVFEGLAGDLLSRLGYPLSGVPASEQALDRICRATDWWQNQTGK